VLILGVVTISLTTIFFGFIPELVGGEVTPMFWAMSGVRVLQGAGMSCAQLASFATLADTFPNNKGLATGGAISCLGLGRPLAGKPFCCRPLLFI
jgi:MFS family permease